MGDALSTGKSAAEKAARRQKLEMREQKKKESLKLAEAESDIARRKTGAKRGQMGRQSLIRTSEQGVTSQLGG